MPRRYVLTAIGLLATGVLVASGLRMALTAASCWAELSSSWARERAEEEERAQLAARLTPTAPEDDQAAAGLTAEAVMAALKDAGFVCGQLRTERRELLTSLETALRHYNCYVRIGDQDRCVQVLSYSDSDEARRVAWEQNDHYWSTQGNTVLAISRGPIVLTVATYDPALVAKLRALLDAVE